jgi:protoheme IX farnesyltransferase
MVLVTTGGGLWLAPGELGAVPAALTMLGTAGVVGAANMLNCYLERESDRFMKRTKDRPLATGSLDARFAATFAACLALVSLGVLLAASNVTATALAALAFVSYVWVYTPMKKRSPLAVIIGTLPGAIPPVIGWAAVGGALGWPALVLFMILVFWQVHHFLAIAINQEGEYRKAGLATFPGSYGMGVTRWSILASTLALVAASLVAVPVGLGSWLYLAVAVVLGVLGTARAIEGFRTKDASAWAYRLFRFTLFHLGLLFIALAIDGVLFSLIGRSGA